MSVPIERLEGRRLFAAASPALLLLEAEVKTFKADLVAYKKAGTPDEKAFEAAEVKAKIHLGPSAYSELNVVFGKATGYTTAALNKLAATGKALAAAQATVAVKPAQAAKLAKDQAAFAAAAQNESAVYTAALAGDLGGLLSVYDQYLGGSADSKLTETAQKAAPVTTAAEQTFAADNTALAAGTAGLAGTGTT